MTDTNKVTVSQQGGVPLPGSVLITAVGGVGGFVLQQRLESEFLAASQVIT